jgi:hypothetical protein
MTGTGLYCGLEKFLEHGKVPLSNNLCEANIKPFATARRAWLFADTPNRRKEDNVAAK